MERSIGSARMSWRSCIAMRRPSFRSASRREPRSGRFAIPPDSSVTARPIFEIRDSAGDSSNLLVQTNPLGAALAKSLGNSTLVLMRGHGFTVAGGSLREAVYNADQHRSQCARGDGRNQARRRDLSVGGRGRRRFEAAQFLDRPSLEHLDKKGCRRIALERSAARKGGNTMRKILFAAAMMASLVAGSAIATAAELRLITTTIALPNTPASRMTHDWADRIWNAAEKVEPDQHRRARRVRSRQQPEFL